MGDFRRYLGLLLRALRWAFPAPGGVLKGERWEGCGDGGANIDFRGFEREGTGTAGLESLRSFLRGGGRMGRSVPKFTGSIAEGRRDRFLRIGFTAAETAAAAAGTGGVGCFGTTGSGAAKMLLRGFEAEGAAFGISETTDDTDDDDEAEEDEEDEEGGCGDTFDDGSFGFGFGRRTEGVGRGALDWTGFETEERRGYMPMGLRFGRGAKLKRRSLCLGMATLRLLSITLSTVKRSTMELGGGGCCCSSSS